MRWWVRAVVPLAAVATLAVGCADVPVPGATPAETPSRPRSVATGNDPERITIVSTGDVLLHERLWVTARRDGHGGRWDFAPLMAPIRPLVASADVAICHLETPLADPAGPYLGFPRFSGPPQIAAALKRTGYDACSTASNHSLDHGEAGVRRTLAMLDKVGLRHAGTARTAAEAAATTMLEVRGVKIALLSYSYGFNGIRHPGGKTWLANQLDAARIRARAVQARKAGANIVVLACHWGDEYRHTPNAQQLELGPALLRHPDIDLVVGHHAHVVQPMEKVGEEWIGYGAGNLIAAHRTPVDANSEGLLSRFTFERRADGRWTAVKAEYAPLLITDELPVRVLDVRRELAKPDLRPALRARLEQALRRTDEVVTSRGARPAPIR